MNTLKEFLKKSGYSANRIKVYQFSFKSLEEHFKYKKVYTQDDIDKYSQNLTKNKKEELLVITKYLRLINRLIKITPHHQEEKYLIEDMTLYRLKEMEIKNYSPRSIHYEKYCLDVFLNFTKSHHILYLNEVTKQLINSFKQFVFLKRVSKGKTKGQPLDIGVQSTILHTVKRFFDFMVSEEKLFSNPTRNMSLPKKEKKISRNILSKKEIQAFFNVIDTSTIYGFIDRCVFELLYSTGIRQMEFFNLQIKDINFELGFIYIRDGKGRKDRTCVMTSICKSYLLKYLEHVRPRYFVKKLDDEKYLFPSKFGGKLSIDYLSRRVKYYKTLAEIPRDISAYAFRRSFATHLLEEGVDIRHIQLLLGHENINTTMKYVYIVTSDLRKVLLKFHPREVEQKEKKIIFRGDRRT